MGMTVQEIRDKLREADEGELAALERALSADTRKGVRTAIAVARRRISAEAAERQRVEALYSFEQSLLGEGQSVVVGLDEVGRGALAGPLAVGAVVLPRKPLIAGLNDSKQLTADQRDELSRVIKRHAVAWAVHYVDPSDIDRDGMTSSLRTAFSAALGKVESAGVRPDIVLIDGNPLRIDERELSVVKGDGKCASIAAASIVAKVTRDGLMKSLDHEFPGYGFADNKGYGSAQHIEAIKQRGISALHRKSFCKSFMQETLF